MKSRSTLIPPSAFWCICLIALAWLAATVLFETRLGWPETSIQWLKRLVGWSVELWLVRTLFTGVPRCVATTGK
jgi:hypothetical protein